jgi:tetratricopeptide (TPR) repeat protein
MNYEQLIDHFDKTFSDKGSAEADPQIQSDPETAREFNYLRMAVDGIEEAALYEQIESVKLQWKAQQAMVAASPAPSGAVILRLSRIAMRVAACVLVLAGGAVVYKYMSTSAGHIYSEYSQPYDLNTSRGVAAQDEMDEAYRNKNWTAVTELFKKRKDKTNKTYFLAGMAALESKNYDDAIGMFQQVIAANTQSGSDYFEDEAEFYLAMSWLARNEVKEAMPLLDKIRADKNHLYHDVVVRMSTLDLRIAQYKELK